MGQYSRREFLKTGLATGALAGAAGTLPLMAETAKASDYVTLGRSGVKVTRLAFGTGTRSGETLIGEGSFGREDRQRAMKYAFRNAGVDSVTVGYKNRAEVDEAIDNLNAALA